ncbi:hypothetical protein [Sphaerotilus sp.]|uniref:hypothetical protein n=1 Tax=Sphaerotilus sp. TaxID=2093942 RepID=UPI0025DC353F|nr:hypothetical protein [Sphaerotilus sp.]
MHPQARLLMFAPLLSALLSAVLWVLLSLGEAQAALPDPTRPPAGMASPPPSAVLAAPLAHAQPVPRIAHATTATTATAATSATPTPRVQALQFTTTTTATTSPGSATALVDGRLVRIGDRLGDATVQDIRADGVWLRLPRGGTQWLGLYAMTEPPPPNTAAPAAPATIDTPMRKEP